MTASRKAGIAIAFSLNKLREHVNQEQWWEALSALNQLDHPWWQRQAEPIRQEVEQAIDDF